MGRFRNMSLPMMPALCASVVTTCLFVTGVFAPGHWVMGTDTMGAYQFSPFSFCRGTDGSLCGPWDDHTYHEHHKLAPKKEEHVPTPVSCSHVVLSVAIVALLVNNCLLLWCACISPTQYWAKNALECTISGCNSSRKRGDNSVSSHKDGQCRKGIIHTDSNVSMSWGAYLVMAALVCQLLTALFTYLAITSSDALHPDHSSTTVCAVPITEPTASATEPGSVPQSHKASPAREQDPKPEQLKKLKGMNASEDKMGSELLRMVHMYHQNNQDNLMLRPVRFPLNSRSAEATSPTLNQLGMGAMAMSVDLCTWMNRLSSNNPSQEDLLASRSREHSRQANSPSDLKPTMGEQSTDQSTTAKQADTPTDPKLTEVKSSEPGSQPATVTSLQQVSIAMTPTAPGPPLQADAKQES